MFFPARFAVLLCFSLPCYSSHAADIYRWVDDKGRTHISDSVPEEYKKSATKIDSRKFEVSNEQRLEAEARAARDRARAKEIVEKRSQGVSTPAGQAGPGTTAGIPASGAKAADDCAEQYRRYKESLDCFAPYVTARGAVKVEAFEKCTTVADPSHRCGPPKPDTMMGK